jgi:hypothetical protein
MKALRAAVLAAVASTLIAADYVLPEPDGGSEPSPPSLVGLVRAASAERLMVLPKGAAKPVAVGLTPQTLIFTTYGGIVPVDEIEAHGGLVEIWYTPETHAKPKAAPVAARVRVDVK